MVADLNVESFASAYEKFTGFGRSAIAKDEKTHSQCFALKHRRLTFTPARLACFVCKASGKFPWHLDCYFKASSEVIPSGRAALID